MIQGAAFKNMKTFDSQVDLNVGCEVLGRSVDHGGLTLTPLGRPSASTMSQHYTGPRETFRIMLQDYTVSPIVS